MGRRKDYAYHYPPRWQEELDKVRDTRERSLSVAERTVADTPSTWDTGKDVKDNVAKDCSWCEKSEKVTIKISWAVYTVIKQLCVQIKDEWQMLLIGEVDGPEVLITGYYIPRQEVSGADVKNLDCISKDFIAENKIVATIHSHSSMGVFFSSVDDEKTNLSTIKYHIVTNNEGAYKACQQITLPCGLVQLKDADMTLQLDEGVIVGLDNISKAYGGKYVNGFGV